MEIKHAELATIVRGRILEALLATLQDQSSLDAVIDGRLLNFNVLTFLKDTETRGLGPVRTMRRQG